MDQKLNVFWNLLVTMVSRITGELIWVAYL